MAILATHRRSAFPLFQPEEPEIPLPPIIQPPMSQETSELSLLQKIWSIFCCCCPSKPILSEPKPPPSAATFNFDDLLFDTAGTGDRFHHVIRPMRRQDFLTEQDEESEETLYQRLNRMDYSEVQKVIAIHSSVLLQEKSEQLSSLLDEMYTTQPFLNPKILSQKISDLPPKLISDITEQASLSVIHATGKRLVSSSSTTDPYTNIDQGLTISYIFPSRFEAQKQLGRYPETLQQKADCIRWGALHHYHPECIPESMSQSHTESQDLQLDYKHPSTTEELSPTSYSYQSGFDKDPSLETLPGEDSLQSQFKTTSASLESLKDTP